MKLGTESRGKTVTAIVLVVVAVLVLVWQLMPSAPTASAPATVAGRGQDQSATLQGNAPAPRRGVRNTTPVLAQTLDPRLRIDLLKAAESTEYEGRGRNIFRGEAEAPPVTEKPVVPVMTQPEPQGPPPPPPINIKFFGFASRSGEARQVFLSQNGDIFVAKEGDIVNRRYRIVRINPTSIEVEDVLSNNRQSIPLQQG